MVTIKYYPGKKGQRKLDGYISAWSKPSGKFWKRNAIKKFRKFGIISNGFFYKKCWGWFEWN